jgi:plastocyanin
MTFLRWRRLPALGVGVLGLACGGGGGGGGMGPCIPGAATQLAKTSGNPAAWYLNNPLPAPLSVTARDASNCAVPGVVVNWAIASGGGAVNPAQSTSAGVSVNNNSFDPNEAVVKTGGTVTWTWNSGVVQHNVTYSTGPGTLPANSPTQAGGTTFSTTFTSIGTYAYHCSIHAGMDGTIKVVH